MKIQLPVSLIIPCFNRLIQTENLLKSLERANFSCEIILIDDCSSVNLGNLVALFKELDIKYYRNERNSGPAFSRNRGIELAQHEYIAFTDNDCEVTADWLIRLHEYLSNTKNNIAGVGGRVLAKQDDLISNYYSYHKILDPWFYNGRYLYIVTANAIFRKSKLMEVGGFDTEMKKAGGEDPGLCFKLLNTGYEFLYCPEAVILHDYDTSWKGFYKTFYQYGLGCSIQTKKYFKAKDFKHQNNYALIDP